MLTLMREMSVISVSVLSNRTSSLTRPLLVPTEMNLDNATTHHLLKFNKSNQGTSFAEKTARRNVAPEHWVFLAGTGGGGGLPPEPTTCTHRGFQPEDHMGTLAGWAQWGQREPNQTPDQDIRLTLHRANIKHR